jgi:DNA-binding transcriptional MerR regulator
LEAKKYFTMREVARKTQLPEYTLRYWEQKFRLVRPLRLASGHRRYTQADIDTLLEIKDLVFVKGYALDGARKALSLKRRQKKPAAALAAAAQKVSKSGLLEEIRRDLRDLIKEL